MDTSELEDELEAILFVAGEAVSLSRLSSSVEIESEQVLEALNSLKKSLQQRGLRLIRSGQDYSLVTAPEAAQAVERYLGNQQRSELSKPALETLAIIAYKEPLTKSELEQVRGVSSDQTIKNLLMRGLIVESGHAKTAGKPVLYRTSLKFLELVGLNDTAELPAIDQLPDISTGASQ